MKRTHTRSNILVIGASGRLGLAIIRVSLKHPSHPRIHAFARAPSKIPNYETSICETVQQGDALNTADLRQALENTNADTVIVAIGVPNSTAPSNLREDSAKALVKVLRPGSAYDHVRVVCISSIGAGSYINVGLGIGALVKQRLKHLLRDHEKQEEVFWQGVCGDTDRVLVVRPTGLLDGKPKGRVVTFGDGERVPSVSIDREEVAGFLLDEICGKGVSFGKAVNIASTSLENRQWGLKALLTLV